MTHLFEVYNNIALPIMRSDSTLPVRKIYCVGQNYKAHAEEMGGQVDRKTPFFFVKSPFDILTSGATIDYPLSTEELHYEIELVVVLGKKMREATIEEARSAIFGYAAGLDLTKRDFQKRLKNQSLPWALSKSFSHSAVISPVNINTSFDSIYEQSIVLKQNGETKQQAKIGDMSWNIEELIVYLSTVDTLYPGDVIFTGTPSGVGAISCGDEIAGAITDVGEVHLSIR